MTARGTDWSLAALTALLVLSGLASWLWSGPGDGWIVVVHDVTGLGLTAVVAVKFRRVWSRLARGAWDRRMRVGVMALGLVWLALGTGIAWSSQPLAFAGFSLLAWHTAAGGLLAASVMATRRSGPSARGAATSPTAARCSPSARRPRRPSSRGGFRIPSPAPSISAARGGDSLAPTNAGRRAATLPGHLLGRRRPR